SVVREIRTLRSVGGGGGGLPLPTRWMWKRSHGRTSEAPPDERGGNRYVRPTATASHLDSTHLPRCHAFHRRSLKRAHSRRSASAAGTGLYVESPGGLSPPGAPRSVREPLDSYGSRCSAVSMTELPVGEECWIDAA